MSSKYYYLQREKQQALLGSEKFNGDQGNGKFGKRYYPFVLSNGGNNLFPPILDAVKRYFAENKISWWNGDSPSGHVLSSQIACLNHLFAIRHDKEAVLKILNGVCNEFVDVLPIKCDKDEQFIAFEVVSQGDYLNEVNTTRGANCTSVDAFILAKHKSNKTWLIPIEWKYTEHYYSDDKSSGSDGATRIRRYNNLIKNSAQLKWFDDYKVYYQEPFYQLMRQTLWAEQMIAHQSTEILHANDFLHIHVIPKDNEALLRRNPRFPYTVSGESMESTWRSCLKDPSKYIIVDQQDLLTPIVNTYPALTAYLNTRYW